MDNETKLASFLDTLKNCQYTKLTGLMGYEAQTAGVPDENSPLIRLLKKKCLLKIISQKKKMFELILSKGHELDFINGGGTGSLKTTREEEIVTEVTVGSAFYAPALFAHYQDFKLTPALFFAPWK